MLQGYIARKWGDKMHCQGRQKTCILGCNNINSTVAWLRGYCLRRHLMAHVFFIV